MKKFEERLDAEAARRKAAIRIFERGLGESWIDTLNKIEAPGYLEAHWTTLEEAHQAIRDACECLALWEDTAFQAIEDLDRAQDAREEQLKAMSSALTAIVVLHAQERKERRRLQRAYEPDTSEEEAPRKRLADVAGDALGVLSRPVKQPKFNVGDLEIEREARAVAFARGMHHLADGGDD